MVFECVEMLFLYPWRVLMFLRVKCKFGMVLGWWSFLGCFWFWDLVLWFGDDLSCSFCEMSWDWWNRSANLINCYCDIIRLGATAVGAALGGTWLSCRQGWHRCLPFGDDLVDWYGEWLIGGAVTWYPSECVRQNSERRGRGGCNEKGAVQVEMRA